MGRSLLRVGRPVFSEKDISEIVTQIASALRSGWLTSGSTVTAFEEEFRRIVGTNYAVAVSSGTAALHILMSLLGIGPGDEVIVPANTFASTANAPLYVGASPVFADCDIETYNVTASTIESRVTSRTKAVIVVHIGGNPCEMDDIVRLCTKNGLLLIEDCAHAHGSRFREKACGSFGLAGAFSFYPTKVVTSAEGGMIVTDRDELCSKARVFRNVGRESLGYGPIKMLGWNYRMTDIHACIGLNQLRHLQEFVERRNTLATLYHEALKSIDWLRPQQVTDWSKCSYYAYICRLLPNAAVSRDRLIEYLKREGIESTIMFRPVYTHPYLADKVAKPDCPNASTLGNNGIVLPLHTNMTNEDVRFVTKTLQSVRA